VARIAFIFILITIPRERVKVLAMPTLLRTGRFRFFFFSNESNEPPHIHVKAGSDEAKFWLHPIELASNYGFNERELRDIKRHIDLHQDDFLEAWNEYFAE
jgi:hypothetical protein